MSLRLKLFVVLGSLFALLVAGEWWLVRSLTEELSLELGEVALTVGRRVLHFVAGPDAPRPPQTGMPTAGVVRRTENAGGEARSPEKSSPAVPAGPPSGAVWEWSISAALGWSTGARREGRAELVHYELPVG